MKNTPLTENDLVIGSKYVPHSKKEGSKGLKNSFEWKTGGKEQGFLYYKGEEEEYFKFGNSLHNSDGDYFLPSDMTPYTEPDKEETVEEAAIKHGKTATSLGTSNTLSFEMGALWQREQDNLKIKELTQILIEVVEQFKKVSPLYQKDKKIIEKANKHLNQ